MIVIAVDTVEKDVFFEGVLLDVAEEMVAIGIGEGGHAELCGPYEMNPYPDVGHSKFLLDPGLKAGAMTKFHHHPPRPKGRGNKGGAIRVG
jgi:hypothetical protein